MLKDKIQQDLQAAMIAKEEEKLSTLRMLKSALQYAEIAKGLDYKATDEDVLDVIGKEVKKHRESIELYVKGGRPELADKEKKELEILQSYLPEQMSEEEVQKLVDEAVSSTGATTMQDMGKVMGALMPKVKGKADASMVSNLVRQKLT
ncbi:MAG: GatB/YqeY domain-containing protein [Candidatus Levyibacteriota bacterium]